MTTILNGLASLDPSSQEQLLRDSAAGAPTGELIDVLLKLQLTLLGEHFVVKALSGRGAQIFDPVAHALLANPLADGARALGEVLVRLIDDDKVQEEQVVPTLVLAAEAALDNGATTHDVSNYILQLRDCANIVGPLSGTASLVRRLHEVASTEHDPYPFADLAARWATRTINRK